MYLQPLLCPPPPFYRWEGIKGDQSDPERLPGLPQLEGVEGHWCCAALPVDDPSVQPGGAVPRVPTHPYSVGTCTFSGLSADQVLFMSIVPESFLHSSKIPEAPKPRVFVCPLTHRELTWNYLDSLLTCSGHVSPHRYSYIWLWVVAPDFVQYIYILHPLSL